MIAAFDYFSVLQHKYMIGLAQGIQIVGEYNADAITAYGWKQCAERVFGQRELE